MKILALETATYFGGIAFVDGDASDSRGPFAPRESSREVLAAAHELLSAHGCSPADLDLIAVSTGPGLFTGVRVGLSIAKTLAWAQGKAGHAALVGVPTLHAVASLAQSEPGGLVLAITDARRGEVYAALFRAGQDPFTLTPIGEDIVVRPERLAERVLPADLKESNGPIQIVGDGIDRYGDIILPQFANRANKSETGASPVDSSCARPNLALHIAEIGRRRLLAGLTDSPETLQPHYVRRPDARLPVAPFLSETKE